MYRVGGKKRKNESRANSSQIQDFQKKTEIRAVWTIHTGENFSFDVCTSHTRERASQKNLRRFQKWVTGHSGIFKIERYIRVLIMSYLSISREDSLNDARKFSIFA